MNIKDLWSEQSDFNKSFRSLPESFEERSDLTKHMVLCIMSELDEILRTVHWKSHRKTHIRPNPQQTLSECIDVFKYLITIVQAWGFSEEDFFNAFWKKSMVVRQRYSEEWIKSIEGPTAVIDIDGVLCDWEKGFLDWLWNHRPDLRDIIKSFRLRELPERPKLFKINRSQFNLNTEDWQELKHEFRISGYKEYMPVYRDAQDFLRKLRQQSITSVLMTSRPIDRYPNLYADTITWLKRKNLEYDIVWWSYDKADRIVNELPHTLFAVDDDPDYVSKLSQSGITTYWLQRKEKIKLPDIDNECSAPIKIINSLSDIQLGEK